MKHLQTTLVVFTLLALIVGGLYPLVVTIVAKIAFPAHAQGSLLHDAQGEVVGSALIGQMFSDAKYFHSRPSATAEYPYNPMASGGSQLGPTNPELDTQVSARIAALEASGVHGVIPADLVTASGSGLDPHISLDAALIQIPRVALARYMSEDAVRAIAMAHLDGRTFGFLGTPRINVLTLNLALDGMKGTTYGAH